MKTARLKNNYKLANYLYEKYGQNSYVIALMLDMSFESVDIINACIDAGLTIFLVPVKDSVKNIRQNLKSCGAHTLIYSNEFDHIKNELGIRTASNIEICKKSQKFNSVFKTRENYFHTLIKTSGTTANGKIVKTSFRAHAHSAMSVIKYFSLNKHDVFALSLPLYHVSGFSIVMRARIAKFHLCILKDFDSIKNAIKLQKISHISIVPSLLQKLLANKVSLFGIKLIIGGDFFHDKIKLLCKTKSYTYYETYGSTETSSMVWVKDFYDKEVFLGGAQIKINKDNELFIKSESLFKKYLCSPNTSYEGEYFNTGDLAKFYNKKFIMLGRKALSLTIGGETVSCAVIENALYEHPYIIKCCVVPVYDEYLGQIPIAIVEFAKTNIAINDVKIFMKNRLNKFICPRKYYRLPPCIKSEHKVKRGLLIEKYKSNAIAQLL